MDLSQITYIGKTDFRNTLTQFGIRARDRFRHMYIIGKSGTGKTTLIENLIVQDIYNGNGVAFIDPHGESADKLLRYIPTSRIQDVIYFNPGDSEFPVAFNPMEIGENATAAERSLITDGLMTVFKKIWPDAFSGRMEYILNNTMLALLEYPEPNLLGITRMLTDKEFRKKVITSIKDPTVRNAWDELAKWDDKRWSEAIGALVNKIGQFTTNPIVRNIIGQSKSTFSFRQVMDERKILIMNMSKGLIGDQSAALLGAMLITKIYLAGMSRANMTPEELLAAAPLYFYVDEFQNFANDSFANILSEARKYKLALTVANQYIAQMEETIRDAVFGNMGTTITFRLGPLDAEFIERVYEPVFNGGDLQNIAFGQIFLTLLIDGMASKPFSAVTLPPIQPREDPQRQHVIDESRRVYARPRAEIEEKIMGWFMEQRSFKAAQKIAEEEEKPETEKGISGAGASRTYVAPVKKPATETTPLFLGMNATEKPKVSDVMESDSNDDDMFGFDILVPVEKSTTVPVIPSVPATTRPSQNPVFKNNAPDIKKPVSGAQAIIKPAQAVQKTDKKPFTSTINKPFVKNPAAVSRPDYNAPAKKPDTTFFSQIDQAFESSSQTSTTSHPSPANPPIKKDFSKAAKGNTKNALMELLRKTQEMRTNEIQTKQSVRPEALSRALSAAGIPSRDTAASRSSSVPSSTVSAVAPSPVSSSSTRERLEQIFRMSSQYRGNDDLPETGTDTPAVKEVPMDVLNTIFQS